MPALALLGVGWVVGGWIGGKQTVAVARWVDDQLEWVGGPHTFRLSQFDRYDWGLRELIALAWPSAPPDVLHTCGVVLAIAAPLGFPRTFKRLLSGEPIPPFPPAGRQVDNPLAYRACERHVFETFGKKPPSAPFDKLGNHATVAIAHARRWADGERVRLVPFHPESDGAAAIIEVYPALCKRRRSYRHCPQLLELIPPRWKVRSNEADAAICALLALAFRLKGSCSMLPRLIGPEGHITMEEARQEGWMYYPPSEWIEGHARLAGSER
jgi:hypothetical protein